MKRILALVLLAAMACGLWGCSTPKTQAEPTVPEPAAEATLPETEPEPEAAEGNLFLKTPAVTLTLVGDSEDIYMGLIPRELVTWESGDPNVVSVEDGVLTATGVGETTVKAVYADRTAECRVSCLAASQEELENIDLEILAQPKRLPPEVDLEQPCTYFDDAAIVGDSITYILFQRESKNNYLGNILFLARGGVSMNGFALRYKNIYYKGLERNLEDAIAESKVKRVYFLMGSNDIGDVNQRPNYFKNWDTMLQRIREKSPGIEIVITSNIPQFDYNLRPNMMKSEIRNYNELIVDFNKQLREYARENDCKYLDLCYYVQDHYGRLPKAYSQDNYHMSEEGCLAWMKVLRYYAQYELEGGNLT